MGVMEQETSDQSSKLIPKVRIPSEVLELVNQRRLEAGHPKVTLELVQEACKQLWINMNPWANSLTELWLGEESVKSILMPLEQQIALLNHEPVPVDSRHFIKSILLSHHYQKLSVEQSLDRLLNPDNGISKSFVLLAKDFSSPEDCIIQLTAEVEADSEAQP